MQVLAVTDRVKERFYPLEGLDTCILVDTLSGSVYQIDEETFDIITSKNGRKISPELTSELEDLLCEPDLQQDFQKTAGRLQTRDFYPRGLCLNISHACNMKCRYCFARKNTDFHENLLMPEDVARKSVEFLMDTKYPSIEIDFFGGEPLLNWEVVENTIIYAEERAKEKGKELKLVLTTNGLLLNDRISDFLNIHDVNLTLSLDGPPEVNDKMRRITDGRGSFFRVVKNFKKALEKRNYTNYYLRGTYTCKTLKFYNSAEFLINQGFKTLSLEPVTGKKSVFSLTFNDLETVEKEYEKLAGFYLDMKNNGEDFDFYHFNLYPYQSPCLEKRLMSCSAGMEYLAVSPEGKIYPCHQFAGKEEFCLGGIKTGIVNDRLQERFKKANVLNQTECLGCWARFYCSGGCYASNFNATGDILKPDKMSCQLMKIRLKYALLLEVKIVARC